MSVLPIVIDRDDGEKSRRRQLLALHEMRRVVERNAFVDQFERQTSMAVTPTRTVRKLLELIAALDRRVPQAERAGEAAIALDAAALKVLALRQIDEIERDARASSSDTELESI